LNICVFASGSGSNFNAIVNARSEGVIKSDIKLLITNNSDCGAVSIAKNHNIQVEHISRKKYSGLSDDSYAQLFIDVLRKHQIDFIVLAGYMKMLDVPVIKEFSNRIINIHPALLPSFGGQGMYGMNVHRAVLESGVKVTGITVHLVDENYDRGRIIFQKCTEVLDDDDENTLQQRVLKLEHIYYSQVISDIENGIIKTGLQ